MTNDHPQKVSRRSLAIGASAGIAAASLSRYGRVRAARSTRVTAFQERPFAGQTLVVEGPAYHAPHVPEFFIESFKEKTGADVEWVQFPGGEQDLKYSSYLVAQESSIDVMYGAETVVARWGPVLLEDITGLVDPAVMDDIVPAANAAFHWQGRQYGVPFDSNLVIFMWNKELYAAAGLDPDVPPQNWAEFLEFSERLTNGDTYGTMIVPNFFPFAINVNSTGGGAFNDDLTQLLVDTDEGLMALQSLNDAFAAGVVDPISRSVTTSIEQGRNFRAGRFGHYIAFPNHYTLTLDETDSAIVGQAATGLIPGLALRSGTSNGIEGYVINRFSNRKELALAFLEHTMSWEVQEYTAVTWGRPPASTAALNDEAILAASPQFETVREQAQFPSRRYGSPFYADIDALFAEEIIRMGYDGQSVEDTAASLQSKGQAIVDAHWDAVNA